MVLEIGKVDGERDDLVSDVCLLVGGVQEEGTIWEDTLVELDTEGVWTKSSALRRNDRITYDYY